MKWREQTLCSSTGASRINFSLCLFELSKHTRLLRACGWGRESKLNPEPHSWCKNMQMFYHLQQRSSPNSIDPATHYQLILQPCHHWQQIICATNLIKKQSNWGWSVLPRDKKTFKYPLGNHEDRCCLSWVCELLLNSRERRNKFDMASFLRLYTMQENQDEWTRCRRI